MHTSIPIPIRSLRRLMVVLLLAVLLLLRNQVLYRSAWSTAPGSASETMVSSIRAQKNLVSWGDPLPRIQCTGGYSATVYAEGLSAPDGLAFSPAGALYVAEETAGRVSQIGPAGSVTAVITGLVSPEGVAFDDDDTLYVVEDEPAGRLVARSAAGVTTTLATDLDAPEGVVWAPDDVLYVTESNMQFATDPTDLRTRVAAIPSPGVVTRIITNTPVFDGADVTFWSYAGLTIGPDGLLYVTNELSGLEITRTVVVIPGILTTTLTLSTTDSIFTVDPDTGTRALFASGLVAPEGPRFSASGGFPLYVAEEDVGGGEGRLSRVASDGSHTPLCTGFLRIEDVAVDRHGWLYVSEGPSGLVILIRFDPRMVWLPLIVRQD